MIQVLSKVAAMSGTRTNLREPCAVAEVTAPLTRPTSRAQHSPFKRVKFSSLFSLLSSRMPWFRSASTEDRPAAAASRATTGTGATVQNPHSPCLWEACCSCVRKVQVQLHVGDRFKLEPEPEVHLGVTNIWIIVRADFTCTMSSPNIRVGGYRTVGALHLRGWARPSRPRTLWFPRVQKSLDVALGLFRGTICGDGTRPFVLQPLAFLGSRKALELVASEREDLEVVFRGQVWVPYACLFFVYGSC